MNEEIIRKFIDRLQAEHASDHIEVTGIIGFGSRFNQAKAQKNSDLDVYIVIKNIGKRYRGVMRIDAIEVDYFVNPIERLRSDWENFKNKVLTRRTIAYLLRDGKIISDESGELKKLQGEAEAFLKNELEAGEMTEGMVTTAKYFIDDYIKDIEDSEAEGDLFAWQYTIDSLSNYLIEAFCQFHKIPSVKHKYQGIEIAKKDKRFVALYEAIAQAMSPEERFLRVRSLAAYCLEDFGGVLPQEWELESPV